MEGKKLGSSGLSPVFCTSGLCELCASSSRRDEEEDGFCSELASRVGMARVGGRQLLAGFGSERAGRRKLAL